MTRATVDKVALNTPDGVSRRIRGLSDRAIAWIFVAPTIFLLLAVNIFPLIWTIRLSFTDFRVNRPNNEVEWVGLENYRRILTDPDIWNTMQATAHFLIWTIVLQVLIGFTLAYLINKKFRGNDLWTTIIVFPMMLSPAVVGNFWTFLLSASDRALQLRGLLRDRSGSGELLDDRRCPSCALGDRDRRHLDVDAVCHADLPGGTALDPGQYIRSG